MPDYRIAFKPSAADGLRALPKKDQKRIAARVDALAEDPFPSGAKKLSGKENIYRVRTGDYRVIYEVRKNVLLILVLKIGHRKEVYRRIG